MTPHGAPSPRFCADLARQRLAAAEQQWRERARRRALEGSAREDDENSPAETLRDEGATGRSTAEGAGCEEGEGEEEAAAEEQTTPAPRGRAGVAAMRLGAPAHGRTCCCPASIMTLLLFGLRGAGANLFQVGFWLLAHRSRALGST